MANNVTIPANVNAEKALLGSVLLNENLIPDLIDQVVEDDFYDKKHRIIFNAIKELSLQKKSVDITTLVAELENNQKLSQIGDIDYLNELLSFDYTATNLDSYIAIVKDASLKRTTIFEMQKLIEKAYNGTTPATELVDELEKKGLELSSRRNTSSFANLASITEKVRNNIESLANNVSDVTGLNTGFDNLNKVTYGFQPGALVILAARPAMGKSAFAMNIAVQAAIANKNGRASVAIFNFEMTSEQLVTRIIASDACIPLGKLNLGNLSSDDWKCFNASGQKLSKLNVFFDDSSQTTIENIRAKCRKLKASETGLDFVVIDYLQLLTGDSKGKSTQEEVREISRNLKLLALELNIPVLALSQLNRMVDARDDHQPVMADLRDSGAIEQDADLILFLYRPDRYKKDDRPGQAILSIGKNRSGATGELTYLFEGPIQKFIENNKGDAQ